MVCMCRVCVCGTTGLGTAVAYSVIRAPHSLPLGVCRRRQVGEKGLTLSGGQKQRLALARAAYCGISGELMEDDGLDSGDEGGAAGGTASAPATHGRSTASGELFLLDDPLSALDASTGRHIFQHLLGPRGLLRRSTRVLVTHALEVLPNAPTVVVLHQGAMAFAGSFAELQRVTARHVRLEISDVGVAVDPVAEHGGESGDSDDGSGEADATGNDAGAADAHVRDQTQTVAQVMAMLAHAVGEAGDAPDTSTVGGSTARSGANRSRSASSLSYGNRSASDSFDEYEDGELERSVSRGGDDEPASSVKRRRRRKRAKGNGQLIEEEKSAVGSVSMAVYLQYFRAAGGVKAAVVLFLAFLTERLLFVGTDWWLSSWMSASQPGRTTSFGLPSLNVTDSLQEQRDVRHFYASGYAILCASNILAVVLRTGMFAYLGVVAARVLFARMLHRIVSAPMSFFDTTPLGRILSRLAHDTDTIDFVLITRLSGAVASYWWVGCAIVIVLSVVPLVVLMLLPVMIIYYIIQKQFRFSSRALQRLDNVTRSPLQSALAETLNGASTIRAFRAVHRFVAAYDRVIDANAQAVYAYQSATRWLGVRVEVMGALVTAAAGVACWLARSSLTGGFAGLAITWVRARAVAGVLVRSGCLLLVHAKHCLCVRDMSPGLGAGLQPDAVPELLVPQRCGGGGSHELRGACGRVRPDAAQ